MPNTVLGDLSKLVINGNEMNIKDATLTETVEEIIYAIQQNNQDISDRINDLNDRAFDNIIKISSNNESEISAINDGLYKIQYMTATGEGEQQTETLNNSAILIQQGTHQYLYKDGKLSNREKTNNTWGDWITFEGGVTSVNGQTGAVTLSIPTKTSDITNDSGFITDAGVTSFNGQTGAVTYTAPVTSVNGQTGVVTIDTGVTSFNGQTGAVTYTAPVTSVNGQTGVVTIDTGVTSFNGQTGAVTYTAPVTSVNGQTGVVTIDLTGKADKSAAIGSLRLSINSTDYKVTLSGTKVDGTAFTCEDVIDLPLETMVVSGAYDDTTQKIILTLKNGTTTDFPVSDLISGLQSEITSTNKLSADLISDGNTNKVVTQTEKDTWNNKVTSVNGQTGAVTIDTGVTSFNGQTGAVTYTAPVTSVNGQTGAVTIDTGVTSFNGQTGAVTYTAPVTSVNGQTGAVVTELSSEYATSTAVNDELELAAGDTYEEAFGKIEKALNDHATITATALNTLAQNSQLNTIESISVNGVPVSIDSSKNVDITISNDNDEVIAEALIDLNDRLEVVEGNPVGDENIIEAVKVNGTALVPDANKAVDISVPVKIIEASAYLRGDINEDGIVDTSHDGTILIDILTGHEEATTKSDINLDGTTDMTDYDPALTDIVLSRDTIGKNILFDTNPYNDIVSAESNSLIPILHITITGRDFSLYVPITKNGTNYTGLCQVFNANRLTYFVINSTEAYGEYGVLPSETDWNNKQDKLVSGTNIKTVNNQSLLGSGNISVGVTSFNGSTGAVTYTAPVTSVNGQTGAVTIDTGVTSFNGQTGAVTYTAPVTSVNGQTGAVNLIIPDAVTESTVSGWGFTKNTGTYSKPSTGIPASDLADGVIPDVPVQSVNGMTGAVTINVGVTSFNGSTGAVTYTAPVTSVNGQTGAVNLSIPDAVTESTVAGWGFTKNTGTLTTETQLSKGTATGTGNAVTDINVSNHQITLVKGATYATQEDINESISNLVNSAPATLDTLNELATALGNDPNFATTVATQIGEKYTKPSGGIPASDLAAGVIPTVPVQSVNGQTGAVNINVGVTSFNGSTGAVTYTAPVTSVNGQTGAVTVKANVQSDWNATSGDAVILNKPTIPTVNDSTVTLTMNGNTVGTFTLNKSGNTTIDLGTVLTSHQSIKTVNNESLVGTGNVSIQGLPTVTSADNGKVLMVVNGTWQLVTPVSLYSGSSAPSNSQGNNGDIYVQS